MKHGTRVEVNCNHGYSLSGDSVITCVKDKNWSFNIEPLCAIGKLQHLLMFNKVSSRMIDLQN